MSKFAPKILIITLIISIIFNINSNGYAYTYSTYEIEKNNLIKINSTEFFSYFGTSYTINNFVNLDKINNLNKESDSYSAQILKASIFTYLSLPFIPLVSQSLTSIFSNFKDIQEIPITIYFTIYILFYSFINSLFVYVNGVNQYNKSYLMTFLGSFITLLAYYGITFSLIINDSQKIQNSSNSGVFISQIIIGIFILPIIASSISTIAYYLSTDPNKLDTKDLEKRLSEIEENYKNIASKIKVTPSSVSFNLAKF